MSLGISGKEFEKRRVLQPDDVEISPTAFNAVIGGITVWGLLLNYMMVVFLSEPILRMLDGLNPAVAVLLYIGLVIVGSLMIRSESPLTSIIGYHLIAVPVGVIVCVALQGRGVETVRTAIALTGAVTCLFTVLGFAFPNFFRSTGRVLGIGLIASIGVELIASFILRRYFGFLDWVLVALFSMYIGYDWARANSCARTLNNAVDLAANLYVDIINLFLRLLRILEIFDSRSR